MQTPPAPRPPAAESRHGEPTSARGPRLTAVLAMALLASLLAVAMATAAFRAVGTEALGSERLAEPTGSGAGSLAVDVDRSADGYAVWARNDDGLPVRWDACSPVELVVDPTDAPPGAQADLRRALTLLRDATGLDLRVLGEVSERPARERPPYQPERYGDRWAPILVAWAQPHEHDIPLRETDRGLAIPVAVGAAGERTYVTGQVLLNAKRTDLLPGFDDRATSWGSTVLHELVHVLGLAHVDDPQQLMYVHPGSGPVEFGDGDLAGLQAVGAQQPCLPTPAPRPVDVAAPHRH